VSQTGYRFDDRSREKAQRLASSHLGLAATASSSTTSTHAPTTAAIAAISSPAATVSAASLCLRRCLLLFHNVDNLVGDAEVFDLCARARLSVVQRLHRWLIWHMYQDDDDIFQAHSRALTYVVSTHVAFRQSEEFVAVWTCLHDLFEGEVHVCVALDEVAVEGFAVLELDEHGVALGGSEEAEG